MALSIYESYICNIYMLHRAISRNEDQTIRRFTTRTIVGNAYQAFVKAANAETLQRSHSEVRELSAVLEMARIDLLA